MNLIKLLLIMANFIVGVEVIIGEAVFNRVNSVSIRSSWQNLGDTCTIRLPFVKGKFVPDSQNNESILYTISKGETVQIKQGDPVTVNLSYTLSNGTLRTFTEFTGFVRRVSPTRPIEITCDDYMYLFRKTQLTKTYKSTNISAVVNDIVSRVQDKFSQYPFKMIGQQDITVDRFRLDNVNAAQALQSIKDKCMLVAWFHLDELYVGLPYLTVNPTPVKYALNGDNLNINDNSLTFVKQEERPFRVKYVGMSSDNKEVVVYYPEQDNFGELVTIKRTDISDRNTLLKLAETLHKQKSFDGYEGTLTGYLIPQVRHSWSAEIQDPEFSLRDGIYMVDSVDITMDRGIRRVVGLGKKLA